MTVIEKQFEKAVEVLNIQKYNKRKRKSNHKKMKNLTLAITLVAMTFGMVACSSTDKKEESTKKETKTEEKSTKKLDGTLKVVTTGDAYQPLFDKFTEEVGPKVEFISMSSGSIIKVKAEVERQLTNLWFWWRN